MRPKGEGDCGLECCVSGGGLWRKGIVTHGEGKGVWCLLLLLLFTTTTPTSGIFPLVCMMVGWVGGVLGYFLFRFILWGCLSL